MMTLTETAKKRLLDGLPKIRYDAIHITIEESEAVVHFYLAGELVATVHSRAQLGVGDALCLNGIIGELPITLSYET